MQKVCLDVIEKLCTGAEERNDRVRACMYVLFVFTIVNKKAAKSMPNYYAIVSNNVPPPSEFIDILV